MSIKIQPPNQYKSEFLLAHHGLKDLAAPAIVGAYNRFWTDPVSAVDEFEEAASALGQTAAEMFALNSAALGFLARLYPEIMADLNPFDPATGGPPFAVSFAEDGSIDRADIAAKWAAQPQHPQEE